MKKVPIWLADEPNSGVFVYWMSVFFDLPLDEIVFVSDSRDINPGLSDHFITSRELIEGRRNYHLPILNLGVSRYYSKQLEYLNSVGGFVFFHQLFLHKLIENFYIRESSPSPRALSSYGRREGGGLTELLADLGANSGLHDHEYYCRTFAVQIAEKAIGFCSSWLGACDQLKSEGLSEEAADRFFYLPPVFDVPADIPKENELRKPYDRRPLRLALLGHKNPLKNAPFCLDVVRALNALGVPSKLVAVGSVGQLVEEVAGDGDRALYELRTAEQHRKFLQLLDGVDLNLHFRHPFGGEMSLTICETMARGVPSVGYAKDWLLDLPPELWVGVSHGATPEAAAATIADAVGTPEKMVGMRDRVIRHMRANQKPEAALAKIGEILDFVRSYDAQRRSAADMARLVG